MIAVTILVINLAFGLRLKMIVVHVVATWPYQKTRTSTSKFIRHWKVATLERCGLVCTGIAMISLSQWVAWMFPTQIGTQKSQIMVVVKRRKVASSWWTWFIGHLMKVWLLGDGMMLHAQLIQDVIMYVNSSHKPNCNFSSIEPSHIINLPYDTFSCTWLDWN